MTRMSYPSVVTRDRKLCIWSGTVELIFVKARPQSSSHSATCMKAVLSLTAVAVSLVALTGCSASARFHSKNGRNYGPLTTTAVRCEENEAQLVSQAGGEVIGTISGKGLNVTSDQNDILEKAQVVAAKKGGTHIVLTEKGEQLFTVINPAQTKTDCVRTPGAIECQTVTTPVTTTTYSHPTASFVVLRLAPQRWASLPSPLRPVPREDD